MYTAVQYNHIANVFTSGAAVSLQRWRERGVPRGGRRLDRFVGAHARTPVQNRPARLCAEQHRYATLHNSQLTSTSLHFTSLTSPSFDPPSRQLCSEFDINFLLGQALEKVAFLHWGYMLDAWRWRTLNGTIEPAVYNHWWWKMRCLTICIINLIASKNTNA